MIRSSHSQPHVRLSLNRLEDREVPAGIVDVSFVESTQSYLNIRGDSTDNHIRVEMQDTFTITVKSDSEPIRYYDFSNSQYVITNGPVVFNTDVGNVYCAIETGNGNDMVEITGGSWYSVRTETGNGDDRVLMEDANFYDAQIFTGSGSDSVSLRDCEGSWAGPYLNIRTEQGDDRVSLSGTNHFAALIVQLGQGDDVLVGDSDPTADLTYNSLAVYGGDGNDRLLNTGYFLDANAELFFVTDVEHQD